MGERSARRPHPPPHPTPFLTIFHSPASEPLGNCLARIARNAVPADRKAGAKKKKGEPAPPVLPPPAGVLALFPTADPGVPPFPADTPNGVAWAAAARLEVGGVSYEVVLNPPTVVKVREKREGRACTAGEGEEGGSPPA